ncbi:hypothetical protein ADL27_49065, partial [Streptomyces sp. NRRL F-6602]
MKPRAHVSRPPRTGNLTTMASRTSGKGSPSSARGAGRSGGPAKKTAAKPPVRKKAPARKAAARKPPPKPAPAPGLYRFVRAVWLGAAHG